MLSLNMMQRSHSRSCGILVPSVLSVEAQCVTARKKKKNPPVSMILPSWGAKTHRKHVLEAAGHIVMGERFCYSLSLAAVWAEWKSKRAAVWPGMSGTWFCFITFLLKEHINWRKHFSTHTTCMYAFTRECFTVLSHQIYKWQLCGLP